MTTNLLEQGIEAYRAGRKDQASALLSEAVRQSPNSARAWFWLGKAQDNPERKKYCFDRAMQIDPTLQEKLHPTQLSASQPQSPIPADTVNSAKPGKPHWGIFVLGGMGLCLILAFAAFGITGLLTSSGSQLASALLASQDSPQPGSTPELTNNQPLPTLSTPPSPTVTLTLISSPVPSATSSSNLTQVYESLGFQVTAARIALDTDQNKECVQYYDHLLAQMPDWATGYYNRAVCKGDLAHLSHNQSEFRDLIASAIDDNDNAIRIGPVKGKYFQERSFLYWEVRGSFENHPAENAALRIALENMQIAQQIGDLQFDEMTLLPDILHEMGRCQEAIDEAKRQLAIIPSGYNPPDSLYGSLAAGYLCSGDYVQARETIEKQIQLSANQTAYIRQVIILIGLGEFDQAYEVVDRMINDSPSFNGYRYYLRSLIHWERGEKELARQDLLTGSSYTWYHGGLYAYLTGLMAIDDDNLAAGVKNLQYAESTVRFHEGPWLIERIRDSLTTLNIPLQNPTSAAFTEVTPIIFERLTPAPPATQIPVKDQPLPLVLDTAPSQPVSPQTGVFSPEGYEDAELVDFGAGTGPIDLAPDDYPLYHFRPTYPIPVRHAKEIHLFLSSRDSGTPPIQVYLWVKEGGWRMLEPQWGDTLVEYPSFYISPAGDTFIAIRNYSSNTTVHIDNASLLVTAELADGEIKTYGKGK